MFASVCTVFAQCLQVFAQCLQVFAWCLHSVCTVFARCLHSVCKYLAASWLYLAASWLHLFLHLYLFMHQCSNNAATAHTRHRCNLCRETQCHVMVCVQLWFCRSHKPACELVGTCFAGVCGDAKGPIGSCLRAASGRGRLGLTNSIVCSVLQASLGVATCFKGVCGLAEGPLATAMARNRFVLRRGSSQQLCLKTL